MAVTSLGFFTKSTPNGVTVEDAFEIINKVGSMCDKAEQMKAVRGTDLLQEACDCLSNSRNTIQGIVMNETAVNKPAL